MNDIYTTDANGYPCGYAPFMKALCSQQWPRPRHAKSPLAPSKMLHHTPKRLGFLTYPSQPSYMSTEVAGPCPSDQRVSKVVSLPHLSRLSSVMEDIRSSWNCKASDPEFSRESSWVAC